MGSYDNSEHKAVSSKEVGTYHITYHYRVLSPGEFLFADCHPLHASAGSSVSHYTVDFGNSVLEQRCISIVYCIQDRQC